MVKSTHAEFDGPEFVMLRDGILEEPDKEMRIISGKEVWESHFMARPGDMIISFSDGVIHAGIGRLINLGWKRVNVMEFIQRNYHPHISARTTTKDLVSVCNHLYEGEPGDDTTVAVVHIVPRTTTRVMVGPASVLGYGCKTGAGSDSDFRQKNSCAVVPHHRL